MKASDVIREIAEATGWGQAKMAKEFDVSQGTISKWLSDAQVPNLTQWTRVQVVIRRDPRLAHLRYQAEAGNIPIYGRVGAGSIIEPELEQIPPDGLYTVTIPFPIPAEMVGFVIEGDSMYPKYDAGDVIIAYKAQRLAPVGYLHQNVVVMTEDGRRYVKKLLLGSKPDLYRLESFNAAPIQDVSITWIGEIFTVVPAAQVFKAAATAAPSPAKERRANK